MVSEPITTLTDYAIAIEAWVLAILLWHQRRHATAQRSVRCWSGAFAATAIAALVGGTCHGFVERLSAATLEVLWQILAVLIGVASFLMLVGTVISTLPRSWQCVGLMAVSIKAIAPVMLSLTYTDFRWVILDYGSAMVLVGMLQGVAWWRGRSPHQRECFAVPSAGWIGAGIVASWAAIGFLGFQWHIGWLQPNDLYHLGQMIALIFFYRGALLLKDR